MIRCLAISVLNEWYRTDHLGVNLGVFEEIYDQWEIVAFFWDINSNTEVNWNVTETATALKLLIQAA